METLTRRIHPVHFVALSLLAFAVVGGALAVAAQQLLFRTGKQIAYISAQDGRQEIYLIDPDALLYRPIRLTHTDNAMPASDPQWSPDGRLIAFVSGHNSTGDIFVTTADGSVLITGYERQGARRQTSLVSRWPFACLSQPARWRFGNFPGRSPPHPVPGAGPRLRG